MSLEIKGKLSQILPLQSGVSKAGKEWSKQEFVIDTVEEQFSKKVCFTLFGDKVPLLGGLNMGDEIEVSFNLESREFNGKWYSNINAWRINPVQQGAASTGSHPDFGEIPPPSEPSDYEPPLNDLPF